MKIAFVVQSFPNSYNTFILNEIVGLLRLGVDISILSLRRPTEELVHRDVVEHDLLDRTRYFDREPTGTESPDWCHEYIESLVPRTPPRWRLLLRGHLRRPVAPGPQMLPMARHIEGAGYDLIHGAFGNGPATAAMVLSGLTGVPFTFETHAYDLFVKFPFATAKIAKASLIFTESEYHAQYLEQLGAPREKVRIVHLSPNKQMLDGIGPEPRHDSLIVSVCRLHPIKGLVYALRAVARLRTEFPGLKYVIAGSGPQAKVLMAETRRLGLREVVQFRGAVTNEDACSILRRATMFVLPSVIGADGDRDGTPTAIAEAMYLEVPVISSRISGIPELVEDGVTGILTPPGDVEQIAVAMRTLLKDHDLRQEMGRAGREKILKDFNVDRNAADVLASWEEILERRRTNAADPSFLMSGTC